MVGLDAEEIDDLAEGRVDLIRLHVYTLSLAEAEATNRRDFINSVDRENFLDKV